MSSLAVGVVDQVQASERNILDALRERACPNCFPTSPAPSQDDDFGFSSQDDSAAEEEGTGAVGFRNDSATAEPSELSCPATSFWQGEGRGHIMLVGVMVVILFFILACLASVGLYFIFRK